MNVPVSRSVPNTVILNQIKLYFRQWPGTARGGGEGAIPDATFVLRSGDTSVSGQTDSEGAVAISLPAGQTARLEIFGTTYEITRLAALEAIDTLRGAQRRLNIIGYRAGPVDGTAGPKTDHSVLCFQADQGIAIDGLTPTALLAPVTRNPLRTVVGE